MEERVHARSLVAFGERHERAVVLSADLTSSTEADGFRDAFPDRFISVGMAEQNMLGIAGGLAREGLEPLVHDFAVFLYRRALDQLQMSVAYPALPVRLLGFLPGLTTPGGVTHQAIDDLAILRAVPNLTILECGDATEVESVLEVAHAIDGPVYVRMLRGQLPRLFADPLEFGRARELHPEGDVLLLSTGACTREALVATRALRQREGLAVRHLHISTLKPFDDQAVLDAVARADRIVTVENHLVTGGLGSAVAEVMAEQGLGGRLHRLGLRDVYARGGSQPYLFAAYGIDAAGIAKTLARLHGIAEEPPEEVLAAAATEPVQQRTGAEEDL